MLKGSLITVLAMALCPALCPNRNALITPQAVALEWRKANLGDHADTAITLGFMGMAQLRLAKLGESRRLTEEVSKC